MNRFIWSTLILIGTLPQVVLAQTIVKSKSAPVQIELPAGWVEMDIPADSNPLIKLMAIKIKDDDHSNAQQGIMLLREPRTFEISLNDFAESVLDATAKKLKNVEHSKMKKIRLDAHDGLEFELTGPNGKSEEGYVVEVIKTDTGYDEVLAYTPKDDFEQRKGV